MFVEIVQVEISQVVVGNVLRKHVVDGDQNPVGDCHCRALVPATGLKAVELVTKVGALASGC